MEGEEFVIPPETADAINAARRSGRSIIAVGTTTVRALESAADSEGFVRAGAGWTELFIYPGYRFKVIDGLVTNFHLPRSTLLMLVCAFAGREHVLRAYEHAVAMRYRFYSYGDAMFIR
jgi:S-adenosylmethionine:tRNA ribosyltransferase-isomerase